MYTRIKNLLTTNNIQIFVITAALVFNGWTTYLQANALQLTEFNHITQGLRELTGKKPSKKTEKDSWAERLIWEYEDFAFLANHRYLEGDFVSHFGPAIIHDCNGITEEFPYVLAKFSAKGCSELRKFYKDATGRDLYYAPNTRQK